MPLHCSLPSTIIAKGFLKLSAGRALMNQHGRDSEPVRGYVLGRVSPTWQSAELRACAKGYPITVPAACTKQNPVVHVRLRQRNAFIGISIHEIRGQVDNCARLVEEWHRYVVCQHDLAGMNVETLGVHNFGDHAVGRSPLAAAAVGLDRVRRDSLVAKHCEDGGAQNVVVNDAHDDRLAYEAHACSQRLWHGCSAVVVDVVVAASALCEHVATPSSQRTYHRRRLV